MKYYGKSTFYFGLIENGFNLFTLNRPLDSFRTDSGCKDQHVFVLKNFILFIKKGINKLNLELDFLTYFHYFIINEVHRRFIPTV